MIHQFLATLTPNVCAKFKIRSSKTVTATLRTNKHRTYRQRSETREARSKPKYVSTVQVCDTVQFSDLYWFSKGTG